LKEGLALREKGDLAGALPKLHLAHTLIATPVTAYELGKTHMMMGQLLSARELFLEVTRIPRSMEESERSETARSEAARLADELEPHIPRLKFKLTLPPGATAVVKVDGVVVPPEAVDAPRRVNPGPHEVEAKAGDGPDQKVKVEVKENETKDVELAPQWVEPKAPAATERPYYVKTSPNTAFLVPGVVGMGAGLVGATAAFVSADILQHNALSKCGPNYCPSGVHDDINTASGLTVTGWASLGLLTVGASITILGLMTPRSERVYTGSLTPVVGLGTLGARGTF
jgi:hypothetical protein